MSNRCGYCGDRGHNRTKCPKMKERYNKAIKLNPTDRGYYDNNIIRQYEHIQRKKQERAEAAKHRRCTYCGEKGHNRTTCEKKKHFFKMHERATRIAQNLYIDAVISTGQFTGSLIEVTRNSDKSHRENGTVVYFLDKLPAVQPLLAHITRTGSDQWYTVSPTSEEQREHSIEFYKSEGYKRLFTLNYLQRCSYKNVRLLGGRSHLHNDIPYYDRNQEGMPIDSNETWKFHPTPEITPEEVWRKLASYWGTLPLYRGYKKINDLEIYKTNAPRLADESDWAVAFRKMVNGDFMSEIVGYNRTNTQTVYDKKDSHCEGYEMMLEAYIDALSSEYERKHF